MMEAGKELDASIIEKVMKWPIFDENYIHSSYPYVTRHKEGFIVWEEESKDGRWFNSSENIADAWQVINKLKEKGFYTDMEMESDFSYVVYVKDGYYEETISISVVSDAKTAPHAICLAALKAIEQS